MSFKRHVPSAAPARGSRGYAQGPDIVPNRRYQQLGDFADFRRACDRFLVDRVPGYVVKDAMGNRYPRP